MSAKDWVAAKWNLFTTKVAAFADGAKAVTRKVLSGVRDWFSEKRKPPKVDTNKSGGGSVDFNDIDDLLECVGNYRTKLKRYAKREEKKLNGYFESMFAPWCSGLEKFGINVAPIHEKIVELGALFIDDIIQRAIESKMYAGSRSVKKILDSNRWDYDEKVELLEEYAAKIEKEMSVQLADNFEKAVHEAVDYIAKYVRDSHKSAMQAIKKGKSEMELLTKDKASKEKTLIKIAAEVLEAEFVRTEVEGLLG